MIKNILITGPPGVGKTEMLVRLLGKLEDYHLIGFYTQEIREHGSRVGFRAVTLDGKSSVFAHRDYDVPPYCRVGRYGVQLALLEELVDSVRAERCGQADLVVIDEIAKMELLSDRFRREIESLLKSSCPVIATVALKGTGFIKRVKDRDDVLLFHLTMKNRDVLMNPIHRKLLEILGPKPARPPQTSD